ncbi:hypothetical protein SDJN02_12652 [Cucurbita argyrosperma subsp. argyrosperma]|nr:hypothetical protein SDJN02_12652 [Cucurbita argyrosperma subsp. argyrosperma]
MGCFLACFGFHKRRKKRRSPVDGFTVSNQIHLSYEPLDSSQVTTCDVIDKPEIQNSKPRDRSKEQAWVKIRKKVSFNLNVQTYEPVPDDHYFLESDEEVKTEEHSQEATARTDSTSLTDKEFTTSNPGNYPQNHRYQNCADSCDDDDEEDDFGYGESDLEDSEIDEEHDEFETNSVDRRQQVHSVLKPIENLTQWRTAKAKAGTISKQQMNNKVKTSEQPQSSVFFSLNESTTLNSRLSSSLPDTQKQENPVHSSLSDWLSELHKG